MENNAVNIHFKAKKSLLMSDFPAMFTQYVRVWAYMKDPEISDHFKAYSIYAELDEDEVRCLAVFEQDDIPAKILGDMGLRLQKMSVEVVVTENQTVIIKDDYENT